MTHCTSEKFQKWGRGFSSQAHSSTLRNSQRLGVRGLCSVTKEDSSFLHVNKTSRGHRWENVAWWVWDESSIGEELMITGASHVTIGTRWAKKGLLGIKNEILNMNTTMSCNPEPHLPPYERTTRALRKRWKSTVTNFCIQLNSLQSSDDQKNWIVNFQLCDFWEKKMEHSKLVRVGVMTHREHGPIDSSTRGGVICADPFNN